MKATVKYFGMIAEKIERNEEVLEFSGKTTINLRDYFEQRYPAIKEMNYKIAVNQTLGDVIESEQDFVEIALLPPFAGG